MSDIFISYKREEQPQARKLADALQKKGWTVWWDPEIRVGERFDDVIEKALNESKCVVVLWSKLSVESQYVKDEATYALNRDKLVPILIEEVNLPFRFERINTGQLIDWDGSDKFPGFQKLIVDVISILGEPPVEEEKRKREQAEREAERKRREDKQRKAEEERQHLEEEKKQRLAEEKRRFEEEQKRIEAARKAEEERKQEDKRKRKAEEEKRRKKHEELKRKAEEEQRKKTQAEAERKHAEAEEAERKRAEDESLDSESDDDDLLSILDLDDLLDEPVDEVEQADEPDLSDLELDEPVDEVEQADELDLSDLETDEVKGEQTTNQIKRNWLLSWWNPFGYFRLLWWVPFRRSAFIQYKDGLKLDDKKRLKRQTRWIANCLIWWPFLIWIWWPYLENFQGFKLLSSDFYIGSALIIVAWLLTGCFGRIDNENIAIPTIICTTAGVGSLVTFLEFKEVNILLWIFAATLFLSHIFTCSARESNGEDDFEIFQSATGAVALGVASGVTCGLVYHFFHAWNSSWFGSTLAVLAAIGAAILTFLISVFFCGIASEIYPISK